MATATDDGHEFVTCKVRSLYRVGSTEQVARDLAKWERKRAIYNISVGKPW
jgi:hypothetical protein